MNKKLPDGWGYTKLKNGKEYITPPSKEAAEDDNPVIENGKDENGDYYEIRKKGNDNNNLIFDPITIEASAKRKKIGRALASKRKNNGLI